MTGLREAAPAKVNLYLHVVGKRADGYHLLDSLAVFPDVGDVVTGAPAHTLTLTVGGPFGVALQDEADNLVLRAAHALADAAGIAPLARLELTKNLPVASGIGGGSADAAATLRVLARLWGVPVPGADLAVRLGADVPVCLAGRPARMGGIGEILAPAPRLPLCGMVLVNPGVAVSTPAIFRARRADFSSLARLPDGWDSVSAMVRDLHALSNDLEEPALALHPEIGATLAGLRAAPGCGLARMSGSGATCFGLFEDAAMAEKAAQALRRPDWWSWGGALCGSAPQGVAERAAAT
jgi:4-diphosphocytidyl-2-C-methyl-D-erythritol kinase